MIEVKTIIGWVPIGRFANGAALVKTLNAAGGREYRFV